MIGEDPDRQRRVMKKSQKQERRVADTYRGSVQPRSGAGWIRKNDVRSENLLIECKFTDNKKSYTIKHSDLRDLGTKAVLEDRIPVLQFDLGGNSYVVLTEDDFKWMVEG